MSIERMESDIMINMSYLYLALYRCVLDRADVYNFSYTHSQCLPHSFLPNFLRTAQNCYNSLSQRRCPRSNK